jgi:thiosulfate reductase/polysulfide reductase chain A
MKQEKHWHHVFCHICPSHCARKVAVENGEIVAVEPDPGSGYPSAKCVFDKSQIMKEVRSHADRLKYPQKRVGARGDGKWERISWDEALDTIAAKITKYKSEFGPDSVAFCLGEPKEMEFAFAQRFASAFGTANVVTPGNY